MEQRRPLLAAATARDSASAPSAGQGAMVSRDQSAQRAAGGRLVSPALLDRGELQGQQIPLPPQARPHCLAGAPHTFALGADYRAVLAGARRLAREWRPPTEV